MHLLTLPLFPNRQLPDPMQVFTSAYQTNEDQNQVVI